MNKFGWVFTGEHERQILDTGITYDQVSNSSSNTSKRSSELDPGEIFSPLTMSSEAAEPFLPICCFVGVLGGFLVLITKGMNNFQHGKFLPEELNLAQNHPTVI